MAVTLSIFPAAEIEHSKSATKRGKKDYAEQGGGRQSAAWHRAVGRGQLDEK